MSNSSLFRLSAFAALVSGVCAVVGRLLGFLPNPQLGLVLSFVAPVFGLWGLAGIYLFQRDKAGVFGGIAYIVLSFGVAVMVGALFAITFIFPSLDGNVLGALMTGPVGMIFTITPVVFLVGVILFGISVIAAGVFSWIAALIYMIGYVPVCLYTLFPPIIQTIGYVVVAAGILWFGISLWSYSVKR